MKLLFNVVSVISSLVGFGLFVHGMASDVIWVMMAGVGVLVMAGVLEKLGEPENDKA